VTVRTSQNNLRVSQATYDFGARRLVFDLVNR
jgi:hypothetical protein